MEAAKKVARTLRFDNEAKRKDLHNRMKKKYFFLLVFREAAKKVLLLMAVPLRGGGEVKGRTIKKKRTFFGTFFSQRSKVPKAIKLREAAKKTFFS